MTNSRIQRIVGLMAFGLLGLIGFQWFWISNALQLQGEQFDYKVTDALQSVVRKLEGQEIQFFIRQRNQARNQQARLMAMGKPAHLPEQVLNNRSLAQQMGNPARQMPEKRRVQVIDPARRPVRLSRLAGPVDGQPNQAEAVGQLTIERYGFPGQSVTPTDVLHPTTVSLSAEQVLVVEQYLQQQELLMANGDFSAQLVQQQQFDSWVDHELLGRLHKMNQSGRPGHTGNWADSLTMPPSRPKRNRLLRESMARLSAPATATRPVPRKADSKADSQSAMLKDVMKGLLLSDRPIEERLDRLALDTLLRRAFQERGVDLPYDFGVQTAGRPGFLFTAGGVPASQLTRDGYKALLFPNNMQDGGNLLYVHFPDQRAFILRRLGGPLAGSAVLILVILACFYVAISTIIRQKKLADIKNDFINNMTHEFKTPISTIALATEMAQDQLDPNEQRLGRYLGIVRDETRRLGTHVEKVLQMALLDRGQVKLSFALVNVHTVIENVLNTIGLQIEQRHGEVDLAFDADEEMVEADELHLTNIVYNLVDNAIKYSPGSPHLTITTRSLPDGVALTVSDRGIGMSKEQQSRIFEQFYRVPTGNRHDVKGFGLGLSYVKRMIDAQHGRISVQSELGAGSTFEIVMPYRQNSEQLSVNS